MMKYQLATVTVDYLAKMTRKQSKAFRRLDTFSAFGKSFDLSENLHNPTYAGIAQNETRWIQSGRRVLFPESPELIKSLLASKITASKNQINLTMPHESMMVAIPDGTVFEGTPVLPFVVTCMSAEDWSSHSLSIRKQCQSEHLPFSPMLKFQGEQVIGVSLIDQRSETFHLSATMDDALAMLQAESFDDACQLNRFDEYWASSSTAEQQLGKRQLFIAFKLALTIAALHSATEGECVTSGFPINEPPRKFVAGGSWDKQATALTLNSNNENFQDPATGHLRAPHWRVLYHEKYYQNQYEHLLPGSRIVFVKPSVVGNISPSTLTSPEAGNKTRH